MKGVVHKAVLKYSAYNRRRKATFILGFLDEHDVKDVLFVGTIGDEWADNPSMSNVAIVENLLAARYPVKMSINIQPANPPYPFQIADVRDMPFEDGYVDFALANAIIEHIVGGEPEQLRMVQEMTRVARTWVITTPNKWFPIESHTSAVLVHWLPSWRAKQAKHFTRLLSRREFKRLLPEGAVILGHWWSPTFTATYAR